MKSRWIIVLSVTLLWAAAIARPIAAQDTPAPADETEAAQAAESVEGEADQKKIKKLFVTAPLQAQLIKGQIAIVKLQQSYELVPSAVAEKIKQRNEAAIILLNKSVNIEPDEDDPYADYQIPDDLMW